MRKPASSMLYTLGLSLVAAALAAAQSTIPQAPMVADKAADKSKDTPAAAAAAPKPAPVKYTELKKTLLWPPKSGVKTPGVQIPMTNLKPDAEIPVSASVGSFLFTTDQVLITVPGTDQILRVEGKTNKVLDPFSGIAKPCGGVANAFRNLWVVSCGDKSVARLETATGKSVAKLATGAGTASLAIASSADSMWMLSDDKTTLTRIDPDANSIVSEVRPSDELPLNLIRRQFALGGVPGEKRILRINPQTDLVIARIEVTPEPVSLAFGGTTAAENAMWVLSRKEGKVARIDPKTNKVVATIDLGFTNADGNIAFGDGFVWVSAPGFPITKISPVLEKEKVVQQFAGEGGGMIQFGLNSIWLTNTAYNNVWRLDTKRIAATLAE